MFITLLDQQYGAVTLVDGPVHQREEARPEGGQKALVQVVDMQAGYLLPDVGVMHY
ncbi:hypothetical protein [Haliea sp.]